MKKILLSLLILLSSVVLFGGHSNATSGTCSSHGGINCSIGADYDNSAICYDGWRDSSENYWEAKMCDNYLCPLQKVLLGALVKKAEDAGSLDIGTSKLCEATGLTGYSTLNTCLSLRGKEIEQVYSAISQQVKAVRYMCYKKTNTCPSNATLSSDGKCYCNNEFQWNTAKTMCIKTVIPVTQNIQIDQKTNSNTLIFKDIDKNYKYKNAIEYLSNKNIIQGYSNGNFKPNNEINRAEFTKILIEFRYVKNYTVRSSAVKGEVCFSDVKKTDWFSSYICTARAIRMINGYSDGSFGPGKNINIAEALKIALKGANKIVPLKTGEWYRMYWDYAKNNGLLLDEWGNPGQKLKRGEMAELIYRLQK